MQQMLLDPGRNWTKLKDPFPVGIMACRKAKNLEDSRFGEECCFMVFYRRLATTSLQIISCKLLPRKRCYKSVCYSRRLARTTALQFITLTEIAHFGVLSSNLRRFCDLWTQEQPQVIQNGGRARAGRAASAFGLQR